jgi:hypothetical protein
MGAASVAPISTFRSKRSNVKSAPIRRTMIYRRGATDPDSAPRHCGFSEVETSYRPVRSHRRRQ